ncbi:hypothetical protein EI42_01335 [Thermosporothrix hazakensis]|uniref:Uncharacterized protein n=1 Tax=Thermosporothrix hazakensis TaxID=644383 RepID=A0A326UCG1_THEHA|nr:hypothetical protein EI42_01335 [Thermosporothrix hazakensis]
MRSISPQPPCSATSGSGSSSVSPSEEERAALITSPSISMVIGPHPPSKQVIASMEGSFRSQEMKPERELFPLHQPHQKAISSLRNKHVSRCIIIKTGRASRNRPRHMKHSLYALFQKKRDRYQCTPCNSFLSADHHFHTRLSTCASLPIAATQQPARRILPFLLNICPEMKGILLTLSTIHRQIAERAIDLLKRRCYNTTSRRKQPAVSDGVV